MSEWVHVLVWYIYLPAGFAVLSGLFEFRFKHVDLPKMGKRVEGNAINQESSTHLWYVIKLP
jgi:hypothetical protein